MSEKTLNFWITISHFCVTKTALLIMMYVGSPSCRTGHPSIWGNGGGNKKGR